MNSQFCGFTISVIPRLGMRVNVRFLRSRRGYWILWGIFGLSKVTFLAREIILINQDLKWIYVTCCHMHIPGPPLSGAAGGSPKQVLLLEISLMIFKASLRCDTASAALSWASNIPSLKWLLLLSLLCRELSSLSQRILHKHKHQGISLC